MAKNEIQPGSIEEYFERVKRFNQRGILDRICMQEAHLLMSIELLIKEHPDIASTLEEIHTEIFTRVKVSLRHIK